MRKIIILGVILVIILIVVFYFLRFSYISYKEIDLAIQQHHFRNKIQNEKKHYDIKQYGYFKEVKYKDEPHYKYTYQTIKRPGFKDFINPNYEYKTNNVKTLVEDEKTGKDLTHSQKAKHQIDNEWYSNKKGYS